MENYIVEFEQLAWQALSPGARQKSLVYGNKTIRLVEFTKEFIEPDWCEKAHIGYILEGEMEINFNGIVKRAKTGDGIIIPDGVQHRHHSTLKSTRLILVEDSVENISGQALT